VLLNFRVNLMESTVGALDPHLRTGIEGERAAFFWLMRRGYVVVARD
jgi:hypothetical protein